MKRFLVVILLCISPTSWAQTNSYLEELGKEYHINTIKKWAEDNEGVWISRPSAPRYYGVVLPNFGMSYDHDYNKVNGATIVTGIEFGKSTTMKSRFANIDGTSGFKGYGRELPFGLKIGMSRSDVESIVGKLKTSQLRGFPEVQQTYINNMPGFRFLNVTFWFEDGSLSYFRIGTTRMNSFFYQKRIADTDHPMRMGIKDALAEKRITNGKLHYTSFSEGIEIIFYDEEQEESKQLEDEAIRVNLHYLLGSDSVLHKSSDRYRVVWCTNDIVDKESFFDELKFMLNVNLDSGFMNNGYADKLVADYRNSEVNNSEYYYYHPEDRGTYKTQNGKLMLHAYQVQQTNEVVLDIYKPGSSRTEPVKPEYIGICIPEDPDLTLNDADYLKKHNIDVVALKAKYGSHPGNALIRVLDGGTIYPDDARGVGFRVSNGYNDETGENWLKSIEFIFDKQFSRSIYKGDLPLGLQRGMSISKIKNVFPGFDYSKHNAKKDWFTTYQYGTIGNNVHLTYTISFRRGKLGRLVIEMDENSARSREWKILKAIIMPPIDQSILK